MGLPVAASQSRAVLSLAAGEDGLAVRAERHRLDRALVGQGRPDGLAGGGVPEPRRLVPLPVRTALPSGLNATRLTTPWCEKTALSANSWLCQAAMLARAACCQPGSPAATAERQLSTIQSRPGPVCPFSKAD